MCCLWIYRRISSIAIIIVWQFSVITTNVTWFYHCRRCKEDGQFDNLPQRWGEGAKSYADREGDNWGYPSIQVTGGVAAVWALWGREEGDGKTKCSSTLEEKIIARENFSVFTP